MRIGILSSNQALEDQRLVEAANARGHQVELLKLNNCSIRVCPDRALVYYQDRNISRDFDAIIPRINTNYTRQGLVILRQFQALDVYTTDTAYAVELGRDKLRCLQYLMRRDIPFPKTGFAHSRDDFDRIIATVGGAPLIIKLVEGTEGVGVFLAEDDKQAINLLHTFKQFDAPLVVQKFIAESAGTDIRCFVIGDEVVAAMQRESQDGDFRANVSLGGHSCNVELTDTERELAVRASQAIKLNIAGVDIVRSNSGPYVIEINVSPDFCGEQGIESVTGVDVAAAIIRHAETGKRQYDTGQGQWLKTAA